jgi:hypothetical protein
MKIKIILVWFYSAMFFLTLMSNIQIDACTHANAIKLVQERPSSPIVHDTEIYLDTKDKLIDNRLQLGVQFDWDDWSHVVNKKKFKDFVTAFNCKMVRIFVFRQDGIGGYDMSNKGPCINWNSNTHTGTFVWKKMDLLIDTIIELGAEPLLCLMYPYSKIPFPRNPAGMANDPNTQLPYPDDWAEYCAVWVRRYGNQVKYWEVMNEPDLYWGWDEDWERVSRLMPLYEAAYHSMKEANPNILISHADVQDTDMFDYHLDRSIPFDFLDFHFYGTGGPTSYGVESGRVFSTADTGYTALNKNDIVGLDFCRERVGDLIQICGEANFNSAWKNGSDIRNQKMDSAVFDALQIIEGIKAGSDFRIHFHLSSSPIYDPNNPSYDWSYGFGMINQQDEKPYYPWYVYRMVGQNLFVGDPIFEMNSSNSIIDSIAWKHDRTLNILLVHKGTSNRIIAINGASGEFNYTKIDNTYDFTEAKEQYGTIDLSKENVSLSGYTVMLLQSEPINEVANLSEEEPEPEPEKPSGIPIFFVEGVAIGLVLCIILLRARSFVK